MTAMGLAMLYFELLVTNVCENLLGFSQVSDQLSGDSKMSFLFGIRVFKL